MDIANLAIKVDSTGVNSATGAMDKMSNVGNSLEGVIKKIAAVWTSWKLVEYAKEAALLSARYETLGVVMGTIGNNAGYTRAQMDLFDKGLQKTGISMVESRNNLTRMAAAQLDLTKASQLGRVAQDAAVIAGINSSEAFENLVQGIVSGQPRILHTMGIFADFGREEKAWAEAHGRTKESLTQVELVQIRLNGALEEGAKRAGAYEASMETTGKQLLSMQRYVDDLKVVFGDLFGGALEVGVQTMNGALKDMKKWLEDNAIAASLVKENLKGAAEDFVGLVKDTLSMKNGLSDVVEGLSIMEIASGAVGLTFAFIRDAVDLIVGAFRELLGIVSKVDQFFVRTFSLPTPEWLDKLLAWGGKQYESGSAQYMRGFNATSIDQFYNGKPDSIVDPTAGYQRKPYALTEQDKITATKRAAAEANSAAEAKAAESSKKANDIKVQGYWDVAEQEQAVGDWEIKYLKDQENKKGEIFRQEADVAEWCQNYLTEKTQAGLKAREQAYEKQVEDLRRVHTQLFGDLGNTIQGWSSNATDALTNFCMTGKLSFKDMVDSMIRDLIRLAIQKNITGVAADGLAHWINSWGKTTSPADGGQTTSPTTVPTTGGPSSKASSRSTGNVQSNVTVHVNNSAPSGKVSGQTQAKGNVNMSRDIEAAVLQVIQKHQRSGGVLAQA